MSVCQKCSVHSLTESLCIVPPLTLFYNIVHSLTLCYTILHYFTLFYMIIHYRTLWYIIIHTIIHYYTLLYTIVHCDFSHCRRETSVWMMWKLMDFIAESRKEKLTRKLLIPCLVQKNLLYFANYKKPTQERRNRRESFWESFSSFLIIGDHKKIWSRAKTIFGTPSLPPPSPPFPPQSSVFQLSYDVSRGSVSCLFCASFEN